ncbi:hypothetical protein HDU89_005510 [Geranomyces variabilis]|nr:hypothetical protein HDU89_005510 [Geranomyces variabilis]
MYFEGPPLRAGTDRTRRTIEYYDGRTEFYDYDPNAIPPQWASWLRHCRDDAPSVAELQRAEQQRVVTVQRARELDRRWEERKAEIEREKMASLPSESFRSSPDDDDGDDDKNNIAAAAAAADNSNNNNRAIRPRRHIRTRQLGARIKTLTIFSTSTSASHRYCSEGTRRHI